MKYLSRTFSVAVNEGSGKMCEEKGHSAADSRGKCLCCGAQIVEKETQPGFHRAVHIDMYAKP